MANRRMFSNRIANSAKFLQMPADSQLLYFHMVLRADDDGIVESYPLMKLLGSAPDVFKVLTAKGFVKELNEDQVVVITDWPEHNTIRADRKVNSIYLELLVEKAPELYLVQPKPRSDVEDNSKRLGGQSTDCISQVKLGKVKLSKDKLKESSRFAPPSLDEVSEYITHNGYSVDPEAWYAFYESNGWKVGKNKMVSWKGAVATWEKRNAPKLDDYQKALKVLDVIRYENGKPNKAYLKKVWNGIDLAAIKVALESFYPDQMELLPRETSLVIQNIETIKKHLSN